MEYLIRKSDFFTWEELPNRDPDTGYVTKAGCIPIIQSLTKYVPLTIFVFHAVQGTMRVVMSHDMYLTAWTPFDVTASPLYELANVIQVLHIL
jgi:hypothetical protein